MYLVNARLTEARRFDKLRNYTVDCTCNEQAGEYRKIMHSENALHDTLVAAIWSDKMLYFIIKSWAYM
jgi:hypothetical protein